MATTMILSASFAWIPLRKTRSLTWMLLLMPISLLFSLFGYLLSRPLGPWLQKHVTTEANLGSMQIVDIIPVRKGVHRVITK
jgi:hypothetical protein